jgi:uncharacterized protein
MKHAVFFSTQNKNQYLYSPSVNHFRFSHPLTEYFYHIERSGKTLSGCLTYIRKQGYLDTGITGIFPFKEVKYQLEKYRFLKKHGYFKSARQINLSGRLHASNIRDNLSSLKQIIIEVTEDCNLACTYCTYSHFYVNKERSDKVVAFSDIKKLLETLMNKRRKRTDDQLIISFYGGEPLTNITLIRNVVSFLESKYKTRCKFKFTMSSNGLLLKKYIRFLYEHAFDVSVSIDGDEFANSYRVTKNNKPSFRIITENLDFIRENYPGFFEKNISFLTVRHNRNSYANIYDFFMKRYGKIPMMSDINSLNLHPRYAEQFRETFFTNPMTDSSDRMAMHALKKYHPRVKEITRLIEHYSGFVFKNYFELIDNPRKRRSKKSFIPTATCSPFSLRAYFSADGGIFPCEHISRIYEIGRHTPTRINIDAKSIASTYNSYYDKISQLCKRCYFAATCKECIFNTKIETGKPVCEFFVTHSGFAKYISKLFTDIEQDYTFFSQTAYDTFTTTK